MSSISQIGNKLQAVEQLNAASGLRDTGLAYIGFPGLDALKALALKRGHVPSGEAKFSRLRNLVIQ